MKNFKHSFEGLKSKLFPPKKLILAIFVFCDYVYVAHIFLGYFIDYFKDAVEIA